MTMVMMEAMNEDVSDQKSVKESDDADEMKQEVDFKDRVMHIEICNKRKMIGVIE